MIVLNIQFWEGDKIQAMALARLIADLEPEPRKDACVLFTARFDCQHDYSTIDYVSKKFETHNFTTRRKATGWPNGPNQMMGESYEACIEMARGKKMNDVQAIMFIEADCVPLSKDWLNQIIAEYRSCGKKILGAWLKRGDAGSEHINGNCIISIDFWRKCKDILHPPSRGGWDAVLARSILPEGYPSKLIWSDYRLGTSDNPWKGCDYLWEPKKYGCPDNVYFNQPLQPVWYHGLKTLDGIKCVREKLLK